MLFITLIIRNILRLGVCLLFTWVFTPLYAQYNCWVNPNQPNACFSPEPYPTVSFAIEKKFETVDTTATYQSAQLIDVNGDCIPEIIMAGTDGAITGPRYTSGINIVNSTTGATMIHIPTAFFSWSAGNSFAMADLDMDGTLEIVVAVADNPINTAYLAGRLVCYNLNGTIKWVSDQQYGSNTVYRYGGTVGFADFNKDGIPEVYIYNEIFNGLTGVKLADGGANGLGIARQSSVSEGSLSVTIAAELDNNSAALELAAGYSIYTVSITNTSGMTGNTMIANNLTLDGLLRDGLTSVADINQDGQLDAVVCSRGTDTSARMYAWYLSSTPVLIASTLLPNGLGPQELHVGTPFIGDIDGSGIPTIGLTRSYRLLAYQYNGTTTFQQKWMMTTNDQSGETGLTMFDFNQDGSMEIVYRDETHLKIIDGSGSTPVVLSTINCISGTGLERPIVGDIDYTNESKICVTCGPQIRGRVEVFSAPTGQQPWAPSRGIWNQYAYHVFNINDNLSIPQNQLNNATFANGNYNNFYVQASLLDSGGNYLQYAANLSSLIQCLNYNPFTNTYTVIFDIYNDSNATLSSPAGVPVAFFNGDPQTTGVLIGLYNTTSPLDAGQTLYNLNFTFSASGLSNFNDLFVVVNTDGSQTGVPYIPPFFDLTECDYVNNLSSVVVVPPTQLSDSICAGQPYVFASQNLTSSGIYYDIQPNASGCDSVIVLSLTVLSNPVASAGNDQIICNGQSVNLTAFGNGSYSWSNGDSTQSINITPASTETYTVTVTDNNGCSASDNVVCTVLALPQANAGPDTALCLGQQAALTASGGVSYLWTPATGLSCDTIANPIAQPAVPTTYTVTITGSNGCSATDAVTVLVYPLPQAFAGNDTSICPNTSFMLNASGGVAYVWSPPTGLSAPDIANPMATPATNTTYTVTVTDSHGCTATADMGIQIFTVPNVQFFPALYNGCAPLLVNFSDSTAGNIYSWSWVFGDPASGSSNTSTLPHPAHTFSSEGIYSVSLTITTANGCSNSLSYNNSIHVYPNPVAGFTAHPMVTDMYQPNITFTNTSSGAISWLWQFGDGNSAGTFNASHTYATEGVYSVKLWVVNQYGCTDSCTQEIKINPVFSFYIPTAFTPNDDGLNDFFGGFGAHFTDYQLYIFDRWGELIYESDNYLKPWNGKYWNEKEINVLDVFVYKIVVKDFSDKQHVYIGHVALIK